MSVRVAPTEMATIAERLFIAELAVDLGEGGGNAVQKLIGVVRQVHRAVSTERITKGLVVVLALEGGSLWSVNPSTYFDDISGLTSYFTGEAPITLQLENTGVRIWHEPFSAPAGLRYVAYEYIEAHREVMSCHTSKHSVPVIETSASYFGIPYFRHLRRALESYGRHWVKNSQCEIFASAWLDGDRLLFKSGPEYLMRRSLQRYLRSHLRDQSSVNVMPEQNVNETRPVDIKVTWSRYNRVALIEIKWLGKSADEGSGSPTANYTQSRAQHGAGQLAEYLDIYHSEEPDEEVRGYLVVFDARRRRVKVPPTPISYADAEHYRHVEINYDATVLDRADLDPPLRFFCEPNLQASA